MNAKKNTTTKAFFDKELTEKNQNAMQIVQDYAKAAKIIERARQAMGKKPHFKTNTSSTRSPKLNTDAFSSTH